jgi:class 3 adenylate cyclase
MVTNVTIPAVNAPADERKVATLLFADLVDSTALGSELDPERLRLLLERFYDAMLAEIEGWGGTVEKFAGDAVMAVFGVPSALEDHAERALHAALAAQRRLEQLFDGRFAMRVGVNTGDVVVGRAREASSFVSGDAVNVAARLEQAARPGEILVGERTVGAVLGAFEFADPATVAAKGKPAGVRCRRLLRALTLTRPRGVSGLARAFVGRDTEIERLRAAYLAVVDRGRPALAAVIGDAGVGKTRLVRELWERLAAEQSAPLLRIGRCLSYGEGITYWPLGEVLREQFGILESDPPVQIARRLAGRTILGLTLGLDVAGDLHPLAARDRLHEAWISLLEELSSERPTVMLLEDLHWAEPALLELVDRLVRDVQAPLLVIVTGRPELVESRAQWEGGRVDSTILWLEPLGPEAAGELVDSLLGGRPPAHVRSLAVERSEGNPFFLEEILSSLIDRELLSRSPSGWRLGREAELTSIPDSVQAVVAARIDLLRSAEKTALQAAAVIGRVFWTGPVYELAAGGEPDLRLLEERDFIRRRTASSLAGEREYAFKHALTRQVAYDSLPRATRARLHAGFAEWLERRVDAGDERAPLLAHHYGEAVRPEDADLAWQEDDGRAGALRAKAVRWSIRAAELAVSRYEVDDAIVLLQRALPLETDPARRTRLWHSTARAHYLHFDGESFWSAMQQAVELAESAAQVCDLTSELALFTTARAGMWNPLPDRARVNAWIERALADARPDSPARARALVARALWEPLEGVDAAREAWRLAERLGDPALRSYALEACSYDELVADRYEDARSWAERRLDLLAEINDPDHRADIYRSPISAYVGCGQFGEARRVALRHDEIASQLTAHHELHGVAFRLEIEELAGEWQAVRELTVRAEGAVEANIDTPCVQNPRTLLGAALAEARLGNLDEAGRLAALADALDMKGYDSVLAGPRIGLALTIGDLDTVERLLGLEEWPYRGVIRTIKAGPLAARLDGLAALGHRARIEMEAPRFLVPHTYLEPFALRALGHSREDEALLEQARARFQAMGLRWHAESTPSSASSAVS